MKWTYPLIFLFILLATSLCAQTRNYRHYSVEHGLASSTAYMACQDKQGYIWFATDGGVNRFDGRKFITYTIDDGLSDNDVLRVYRDSKDRIWFFTFNGHLSYYLDGKIHNEKTDPFLRECYTGSPLLYFFEDSRKRLWIGGYNKIITLVEGTRCTKISLSAFPQEVGLEPDVGLDVEETQKGTILLYRFNFLYSFDEQSKSFRPVRQIEHVALASYRKAAPGIMYYYSAQGIIRTEEGKDELIFTFDKSGLTMDDPISINDYDQHLYLTTWKKGVLCFDRTMKYNSNTVCYLPEKVVNSVFMDHEKNLWFMTLGDGIYILPVQSRNALIYNEPYLKNEHTYSVFLKDDSSTWIGCGGDNLCIVKGNKTYNYHLVNQPGNMNRLFSIEKDKENMLWILSDYGSFKIINKEPFKVQPIMDKTQHIIKRALSLTFDSRNNGLILYPYLSAQIIENHNSTFSLTASPIDTLPYVRNFCTFYDVEDRLYVADISGLVEIIDKTRKPIAPEDPLLRCRIVDINQTFDSTLVLGTDGNGLLFVKNQKMTGHLTVSDGLPSNSCRKVKVSGEKIYVCTNNGLCEFSYHHQRFSGMRTYSVIDGLASNDVRDVEVSGNQILAATIKGLSILTPSMKQEKSDPPFIFITGVKNNFSELNWNAPLTIKHHNNLIIYFSALTYSDPDRIAYQYSLTKDDDTNWVTTTQTEIALPSLPPGTYSFKLKAKKSDSQWSAPVFFSFRVTPPFYKAWWFNLLILLLVLSFFGLVTYYLYRVKMRKYLVAIEKNEALNRERMRISSDMHDDLGSDFSRIAVIAELIKIVLSNNKDSESMAQRISDYVQTSRKKMDEIIWALNPTNDSIGNLVSYCNEYTLNFFEGSSIKVHIETPQNLPDFQLNSMQRRNLFLVIKEITNNAIKHSGASNFFLNSKVTGRQLIISAKDDGKGFKMNQLKKTNGLNNVRKRVKEINGEITILTQPGNGSEFIIELITSI